MEQDKKLTAPFFFLSIGVLVSLITAVTALLNVSFEILNRKFPDVLTDIYQYGYVNSSFEGLRSALALLIIVFPVFLILEHYWQKVFMMQRTVYNAVLKRWALYLILFLASVTIITDLVILVRYFVSGEITVRFILKVALTLIVAGIVGLYYKRKLRMDVDRARKAFGVISTILVLFVIVWSFTVIGNPAAQRKLRLDQRRVDDLQSIQWQIINYWQQTETLPDTLEALSNPISSYMVPRDPEFMKGKEYEYEKTGVQSFNLCATFSLPLPEGYVPQSGRGGAYPMGDAAMTSMPSYPGGEMNNVWDHETGRTCFSREIDPRFYPPFPKPDQVLR